MSSINLTTELDAINACLVAGGEAPVSSVVSQRPDVEAAQQLVREASRDVQSAGWRFNTEHGYEVLPAGTLEWTDSADVVTTLNVFVPPPNLLNFAVSRHPLQQGDHYLDTIIRPSRLYNPAGTLVFYDRVLNRDGWRRTALYIDPVWLFDFEELPQPARHLITIKAKRAYLAGIVQDYSGSDRLAEAEEKALRVLMRDESETDDFNVFNNLTVSQHLGGRPVRPGGVADYRASRGPK